MIKLNIIIFDYIILFNLNIFIGNTFYRTLLRISSIKWNNYNFYHLHVNDYFCLRPVFKYAYLVEKCVLKFH